MLEVRSFDGRLWIAKSVYDIPIELMIQEEGVTRWAFDADNTLRSLAEPEFGNVVTDYFIRLFDLGARAIVIATNSRSIYFRTYCAVVRARYGLAIDVVQPGAWKRPRKPQPLFFHEVLDALRVPRRDGAKTAMVGDKLLFDVLPAIECGMHGVLVNPLGKDVWYESLAFRRLRERKALKDLGHKRP